MLNVINVVILGILAVVSVVLLIFLIPVLRELRKTIGKMRGMADEEIAPLIAQVRDLVEETRPKIDGITQRIESMTDEEIKPMDHTTGAMPERGIDVLHWGNDPLADRYGDTGRSNTDSDTERDRIRSTTGGRDPFPVR